jgi:hypothetical protein
VVHWYWACASTLVEKIIHFSMWLMQCLFEARGWKRGRAERSKNASLQQLLIWDREDKCSREEEPWLAVFYIVALQQRRGVNWMLACHGEDRGQRES